VVGVTGTDGKTTTCYLLHALLQGTGHPAGLIGTVAFRVGEREWENTSRQTTPESPDVQRLLAAMVAAGVEYAVVEATSHALVLERLRGCHFDAGVFTNLTSDHLDFHGTVENYRAAKARLFRQLGAYPKARSRPVAVLNRDDPSYEYMRAASSAPVLSYGLHPEADVRAHEVTVGAGGIRFRFITPHGEALVRSPMTGRFNVSNLLAALAYAVAQGIDVAAAAAALGTMRGVPGRMRRVDAGQTFTVVVDYAHTPDSLAKVLDELRPLTAGRLIAVFGAAGERDRGKRPALGRIAAERCDVVVLTDEDPRLEDRLAIIEEIAVGARAAGAHDGTNLLIHPDRREAIAAAVGLARAGDLILLAGKGHESCIIVGTERIPWDEEAAAREAIAAVLGATP
jgi:UDP-N-acetylmuramoyl-L-alanyl-D-glutamate--2,6-diaminopimelate ligase